MHTLSRDTVASWVAIVRSARRTRRRTVTADFTTNHAVDAYLVDAVPLVVTLDPFAVNNDQVLIQDVTNSAATNPIVINASDGQTILNGYGAASVSPSTAAPC